MTRFAALGRSLDRFTRWSEGGDATPQIRRQRTYIASGLLVVGATVTSFGIADTFGGEPDEATRSALVSIVFFGLLFMVPRWPRPRDLARTTIVVAVAMIAHEAWIGANGGNSFLWFYVAPLGILFVLGRREGAVWTAAITVLLGWVLASADYQVTAAGELWELAGATFALQVVMGYGLESSRERMTQFLERGQAALAEALEDLKALSGLVPICAVCKKTRDDDGYWSDIEVYLARHSAADLQFALCPHCVAEGQTDNATSVETEDSARAIERPALLASASEVEVEHARYRRSRFTIGLAVLIPSILYFGSGNVRAGRWVEFGLAYGLAAVLLCVMVLLRRGDLDRPLYQVAAAVSFGFFVHELAAGAFGGFIFLWLYSYPAFVVFLLGSTGVTWAGVAGSIAGLVVLGPIGFDYPQPTAIRFVVTYALVVTLAYGLERSRQLGEARLIGEHEALRAALARVQTLRGLVPICSSCKRMRDDQGYWEQLERYVSEIAGTRFSHGFCPDCAAEMMASLGRADQPGVLSQQPIRPAH